MPIILDKNTLFRVLRAMVGRSRKGITRKNVLDPEEKFSKQNGEWHPADVKAALEKRGLSLAELSRQNGYHDSAAGRALRVSWPELERIIAEAIGVQPVEIWPARYREDGVPLKYLARSRSDHNQGRK